MKLFSLKLLLTLVVCLLPGLHAVASEQGADKDLELSQLLDSASHCLNSHQYFIADSLLQLAEASLNDRTERNMLGRYHFLRANYYLSLWELQDSEREFLKAVAHFAEVKDSTGLMSAYSGLGTAMCEQNRYHEGTLYQRKALTYFTGIDSLKYYGLLSNMAVAYSMAREDDRAMTQLLKVMDYFKRNNRFDRVAVVENNIGELYRDNFGEPRKAIPHYQKAAKLNIQAGQDNHLAQNYHNMSIAFQETEQFDSAYYYLQKSLDLRRKVSGRGGMAIGYNALGQFYRNTGQLDSAMWAYQETIAISEEMGIEPGIIHGNLGMGNVYELNGSPGLARVAYHNALEKAKEIRAANLQSSVHKQLYEFYSEAGDFESALTHFEHWNALEDSISDKQSHDKLAEIRTRYEMDLAETENVALRAQHEAQSLALERQKVYLLALAAVLVLIALAVAVLSWANRQRKNALKKTIQAKLELQEQYRKLKEQEVKLAEANDLKNRIFSVLGHDLRSPLANISSMLKLISAKEITSDELENVLRHLQLETDLSINTLEDILQWSRMQMDNNNVNKTHLEIGKMIEDLQQIFESRVRLKEIDLQFVDNSEDELWVDEHQFKSIATNLISNALKFSPHGSAVTAAFESGSEYFRFSVSDKGVGFKPEVIQQIHEGKKMESLRGTKGEKGTGIGLQIVRDFVAAHDGKIAISNNQNGGATVSVSFPNTNAFSERERKSWQRRSA